MLGDCCKTNLDLKLFITAYSMTKKINIPMSFSSPYTERRKVKKVFLEQVNQIINWQPITSILESYYDQGKSPRGRKAYPPLVMLKMCLLQFRYI